MQGWDFNLGAFYMVLFLFFGLPVIVLVGRAIFKGSQQGTSRWRALGMGLLIAAATVGALSGWIWLWIFGPIYEAYGHGQHAFRTTAFLVGLFAIPIGGVALGVWILSRMGRAGREQPTG